MRLSIKSLIFACFILRIFYQTAFGVESEFYCEQIDGSMFYYDKDKLDYSSGKIMVWNAVVLSDIGREYVKRNSDTRGINPYKILTYNEVDCKQGSFRVLSIIVCGETKSFLKSIDHPQNRELVPNTCPEELFNILCKQGK
jgi:hypothetical protein